MNQPSFTLTAGPVVATEKVLGALGTQIVYDYDEIFLQRFRDTQAKVGQVFGTAADVVLMQGEAVLGLEAAARGLVTPGTKCVNLVSGVYSKWFGERLQALGADLVELEAPYDSCIDPSDVEAALRENPDVTIVSVVHCESPSGTLNPVGEIGPIARAHGVSRFVTPSRRWPGMGCARTSGASTSASRDRRNAWARPRVFRS